MKDFDIESIQIGFNIKNTFEVRDSVSLEKNSEVNVYGDFVKIADHTYRTEASIEWGSGDRVLGVLVMMNPGEAEPITRESKRLVEEGRIVRSPLKVDRTMRKIITIFEQSVFAKQSINGKLIIYNLFNLQKPDSNEAIQALKNLSLDDPILNSLVKETGRIRKTLKLAPWVWIGWGCKDNQMLRVLQKQWLHIIDEVGVHKFGVPGSKPLDFYHPNQWTSDMQQKYTLAILEQFKLNEKNRTMIKDESVFPKRTATNEPIVNEILKRRIDRLSEKVRESTDYFEYMIVPNYEEMDTIQEIHGVALSQINIVVVKKLDCFLLVSIEFPKSLFTIEETINWLLNKYVYFGNETKCIHHVTDAKEIDEAVLFFGNVIAKYTRGHHVLSIDTSELTEITDLYNKQAKKVNTKHLKKLSKQLSVSIDGKEITELPSMQFDRKRDTIVSNGMIIRADYIDLYQTGIGFFLHDQDEPIAHIVDDQTKVEINTYLDVNANQICVIEYSYNLNLDVIE